MRSEKKIFLFILRVISGLFYIVSALANPDQGLFSDRNFQALQKDPAALFSKVNECRLNHILGSKDYDLFHQSMALMTNEDDVPDYLTITGNVRGLFTIFEGFYRMSNDGKIWLAYLYDNQVHYFTNDEASLKLLPQPILVWSSRFKEAKWISQLIKITPDNC